MNTVKLDTRGHLCPFPLIEAKKAIVSMQVGDVLIIEYDCAQATENIPRWAAEEGHEVVEFEQISDAQWRMQIKKVNKAKAINW